MLLSGREWSEFSKCVNNVEGSKKEPSLAQGHAIRKVIWIALESEFDFLSNKYIPSRSLSK